MLVQNMAPIPGPLPKNFQRDLQNTFSNQPTLQIGGMKLYSFSGGKKWGPERQTFTQGPISHVSVVGAWLIACAGPQQKRLQNKMHSEWIVCKV